MSAQGLFITGTDTGVGKTFVTAALARLVRDRGQRVFAFKPIETGCQHGEAGLVGEDQETLRVAAGEWQNGTLARVYRFEPAVAPLVAAESVGTEIDLNRIVDVAGRGATQADVTLIE